MLHWSQIIKRLHTLGESHSNGNAYLSKITKVLLIAAIIVQHITHAIVAMATKGSPPTLTGSALFFMTTPEAQYSTGLYACTPKSYVFIAA